MRTILNTLFVLCFIGLTYSQTTVSFTTPGTTNWTVPSGITEVTIECWGGGGGGGGARNLSGDACAGGGGGGAYAKSIVSVNPGDNLSVLVGAGGNGGTTSGTAGGNGGLSSVTYSAVEVCRGAGGNGGATKTSDGAAGGAGGTTAASIGSTKWAGGYGGVGHVGSSFNNGGGGGGAGGTSAGGGTGGSNINSSSRSAAGIGGTTGGGNGGRGSGTSSSQSGEIGNPPGGGGGGGSAYNSSASGGAGARGEVRITYTAFVCTPPASVILSGFTNPICSGQDPGTFTATASGGNPVTYSYLWYKDGISTGVTTSTYSPGILTVNTTIRCDVTNYPGCMTSGTQIITVNPLPANKTVAAVDVTVCSGSSTNITVSASTSGVSYQLRDNATNNPIGSAVNGTGGIINLPTGSLTATTTFNVLATIIATGCSIQMTNTPTVSVITCNPPTITSFSPMSACLGGGDIITITGTNFSGATSVTINGAVATFSVINGTTISATVPSGAAASGNIVVTNTYGSASHGALNLYSVPNAVTVSGGGTFCNSAILTANNGGSGVIYWQGTISDGTSTSTPSTSESVSLTNTYYFRASNNGCWGPQGAASVTINNSPSISVQPLSITRCSGEIANFQVTAVGSGLTYQWRKNGVNVTNGGNVSGATSATLSINPVSVGDAGDYDCVVSGSCVPSVVSDIAALTIGTVPSQPSAISGSIIVCTGMSYIYMVANVPGVTYTWTLPSGWIQTSGGNTNQIIVTAGASTGNITVTPSNSCGTGVSRSLTITSSAPCTGVIPWNGYPSGTQGTTYNSGTAPFNMSAVVSSSGTTTGDGTPKYVSLDPGSPCYISGSLALQANTFQNITSAYFQVVMSFNPLEGGSCAEFSFRIKDINSNESVMDFLDVVEITAVDGNNNPIPATNIMISLAPSTYLITSANMQKILGHNSSSEHWNSSSPAFSAACNETSVTVLPPTGGKIKSITVKYRPAYNGNTSTSCSTDCAYWGNCSGGCKPAMQYISISNLTYVGTDGCAVLPVQMLDFSAECHYDLVQLKWSTASELNNDYFTIERSKDNENFIKVGTINGAGTSNEISDYSFSENILTNNDILYYRLSQTDFDGTTKNLGIRSVNCVKAQNISISIYPNPAGNEINIGFWSSEDDGRHKISIYDPFGKLVREFDVLAQSGFNTVQIDLSGIAEGMYVLSLQGVAFSSQQKLILIK
jgi:hypothetical protein